MVLVGEFFFVRNQIVDSGVAILADHESTLAHLLFAEAVHVPFFRVNRSGDEMMLRQPLSTTTQLAARDRRTCLAIVPPQSFAHDAPPVGWSRGSQCLGRRIVSRSEAFSIPLTVCGAPVGR